MGIHYQAFNCKFIITLIILSFMGLGQANADDELFTVGNVKVDVTADNSVLAQNKAFEEAQNKAFEILAKRMVAEAQVKSVATPNSLTISSLVKDYEVTDEKLSAVRYIGTYIFRFRAAAVSKFFSVSGVTYTDTSSEPLLILPILQKDGNNILWSEENIWMKAWGRSQNLVGIIPVEIPMGDLMDVSDIDGSNVLSYERLKLDNMVRRYNSKSAIILIATPDNNAEAITIAIYDAGGFRAEHIGNINIIVNPEETTKQLYDRAVLQVYSNLQKGFKTKSSSVDVKFKKFKVRSYFKNINQWKNLHKDLSNIEGLDNLSIVSMKRKSAILFFDFKGDADNLREVLSRSNIELGRGDTSTAFDIIYDLRIRHRAGISGQWYNNQVEPAANEQTNDGVFTF